MNATQVAPPNLGDVVRLTRPDATVETKVWEIINDYPECIILGRGQERFDLRMWDTLEVLTHGRPWEGHEFITWGDHWPFRQHAQRTSNGWEICNTGKYAAYTDDELAEIIGDAEVTILK